MINLLNKISIINENSNATDDICIKILDSKGVILISFINAHAYNLSYSNLAFKHTLENSDYLFRDGLGMELLLNTLGMESGQNINGTDFIPILLDRSAGHFSLALWGTNSPYNLNAKDRLTNEGLNVISVKDGFQDLNFYIRELKALSVKHENIIVVLGMGMPKQEELAELIKSYSSFEDTNIIIICGGAILDFLGGKIKRAPLIIRKLKSEWIYRLFIEPKRLFRRYVIGNFLFIFRMIVLRINLSRFK